MGVMDSLITLYRLTNPGDNINNVTDKIFFNYSKSNKLENAYVTEYLIGGESGVGDNQSVAQDTSNLQPLGKFEDSYILRGFISQRDSNSGFNTLVTLLAQWDNDPKVNSNWPQGRFGIKFDDFRPWDRVPVGTGANQLGLIWQYIQWKNIYGHKDHRANFEIKLKVSRSDGT